MKPTSQLADRKATPTAEGWAELRPAGWTGKRSARAQHYFLGGRSLCGKRSLDEAGIEAPAELSAEPIERDQERHRFHWPASPCPRCLARSSTYGFRRHRARRLARPR